MPRITSSHSNRVRNGESRAPQIARVRAQGLERFMRDELVPNYLAQDSDVLADLCVDMALALGPDVPMRVSGS